jgi:hypothetical protein
MWTLIDIPTSQQYISCPAVYVSVAIHLLNLIREKSTDLFVGRLSPFLEFLTPGQAARDHVYSTFQQLLVSLLLGYPTSLTTGQALE